MIISDLFHSSSEQSEERRAVVKKQLVDLVISFLF